MPRGINGTFSLVAGNPVSPNSVISSSWANPTMDDLAAGLTDSLSRTGLGGMLAPFLNADGTQANPGISWTNEQTSGWYRSGTGTFTYSVAGANIFTITSAGIALASGKAFSNFNTSGPAIFNGTVQFNEDISIEAGNVLNTDAINSPSSSIAFNLASVNKMTLSGTGLAVANGMTVGGTLGVTGLVTAGAGVNVIGAVSASNYGSFSGAGGPATGTSVEINHSGTTGRVLSYDRTGIAPTPLIIDASTINLQSSGVTKATVSSAGVEVTGVVSASGTSEVRATLTQSSGIDASFLDFVNTGGTYSIGVDRSTGGYFGSAYSFGISVPTGRSIRNLVNSATITEVSSTGLAVTGNLSATGSKPFVIDHPLKPETHKLVHAAIEAPTIDVVYRGVVTLQNGSATVNIDEVAGMTEGTLLALARDFQCFTSNESDWDAVRGKVVGNTVVITCQNPESSAKVSWLVFGERQDNEIKACSTTDDNGKLIVEPLK